MYGIDLKLGKFAAAELNIKNKRLKTTVLNNSEREKRHDVPKALNGATKQGLKTLVQQGALWTLSHTTKSRSEGGGR